MAPRPRPAAARDMLVVLLTVTTGAVDAACFLHLGDVFSSVITGNMVLLGVAAGTLRPGLAVHSGVALAGYAAGVAAGAPIAARGAGVERRARWPGSVTATLLAEVGVLAAFSAGWEVTGGRPSGIDQLLLVAALAAAMGVQSAAVRRLGDISTTYLTGTLTGVVAGLVTRRRPEGFGRSAGVLAAIICGAVCGAVIAQRAPAWLPAMIISPVAAVIGGSMADVGGVRTQPGSSGS